MKGNIIKLSHVILCFIDGMYRRLLCFIALAAGKTMLYFSFTHKHTERALQRVFGVWMREVENGENVQIEARKKLLYAGLEL